MIRAAVGGSGGALALALALQAVHYLVPRPWVRRVGGSTRCEMGGAVRVGLASVSASVADGGEGVDEVSLPALTLDGSGTVSPAVTLGSYGTVSPTVTLGGGRIVSPAVTLGSYETVSPTVTLGGGRIVSPAVTLGSYGTVSPTVTLGGGRIVSPAVTLDGSGTVSPAVPLGSHGTVSPTVTLGGDRIVSPAVTLGSHGSVSPTATLVADGTVSPAVTLAFGVDDCEAFNPPASILTDSIRPSLTPFTMAAEMVLERIFPASCAGTKRRGQLRGVEFAAGHLDVLHQNVAHTLHNGSGDGVGEDRARVEGR
eukprot:scaffold5884_cov110-Isochrysis_galbana.AAC.3